jgi:hypothetical protein
MAQLPKPRQNLEDKIILAKYVQQPQREQKLG